VCIGSSFLGLAAVAVLIIDLLALTYWMNQFITERDGGRA